MHSLHDDTLVFAESGPRGVVPSAARNARIEDHGTASRSALPLLSAEFLSQAPGRVCRLWLLGILRTKVKTLDGRADIQTEMVRPSPNRPAKESPPDVVRSSSGGRPGGSNQNGNWTGNGEVKSERRFWVGIARDFRWVDPYS